MRVFQDLQTLNRLVLKEMDVAINQLKLTSGTKTSLASKENEPTQMN